MIMMLVTALCGERKLWETFVLCVLNQDRRSALVHDALGVDGHLRWVVLIVQGDNMVRMADSAMKE